jgi:hypothetical protein
VSDLNFKINQDVLDFLNSTEKMPYNDKVEMLSNLLKKYVILEKSGLSMSKRDLLDIVSQSKLNFSEIPMPVEIEGSDIPVNQMDLPTLCVVEATIAFLNKNDCLKKLPKFKYKKR